jgi:hypothetical protein
MVGKEELFCFLLLANFHLACWFAKSDLSEGVLFHCLKLHSLVSLVYGRSVVAISIGRSKKVTSTR